MRKSSVSKKSKGKSEGKSLKKQGSGNSKKSKQTVNDQSVVNIDQSALNEAEDPEQQLLGNASPKDNGLPDLNQGIEMQSLEGSIQN